MADDWKDEELAASVKAYLEMLRAEDELRPYSKAEVYRTLAERFNRTSKAFEYRMQNISAVLAEQEKKWIPGLKPASNVGTNIREKIVQLLAKTPYPAKKASGLANYKRKLPFLRNWLIAVARRGGIVTYLDAMDAFGIDRFSLRHAMDYLGHQAKNFDEPVLTALIVSKATGRCSLGLHKEFGIEDDEIERQRLYDYWSSDKSEVMPPIESQETPDIEVRAARFVSVEARPEQATFRRLVFLACKGKCVISGCEIETALDAAHVTGRDWRKGHNKASDGLLLRKDLHALYDKGILQISDDGIVSFVESALSHYAMYTGTRVVKSES